MTTPTPTPAGGGPSRRASNARKRQNRRPSRLGSAAGSALTPDRVLDPDAGFPGLLKRAWQRAIQAPDLREAARRLLTLDGHVPADVQLRALRSADETAFAVLFGLSWRADAPGRAPVPAPGEQPAFLGEIALAANGRILVRVPSQEPLAEQEKLVDGVIRVPWSAAALASYQQAVGRGNAQAAESAADCRGWLERAGAQARDGYLEQLKEMALRTAPFVLYQEDRQYTNFRDRNTVTGKTLWPGHPDCAFSGLQGLPLELWSDSDALMVVCLVLLVRSAGYGRIEEANGTQLSLANIAFLLERIRGNYNGALGREQIAAAASDRIEALDELARALGEHRPQVAGRVQLYREIHGALMHKVERVAAAPGPGARGREARLGAVLGERLELAGGSLDELEQRLADDPGWLARPRGGFATGYEALVHASVAQLGELLEADFAMSRGLRSLPQLIAALRRQDWDEVVGWDITRFFCCVVPRPSAVRFFGGSAAQMADTAWAMSSRMQYNSWHFIAGNLPRVDSVLARDHFVPPQIPDIAHYSDQHHRGHVANQVRFSIRTPRAVEVLDRTFNGFIDLRLLRCEGPPFEEADMLLAHRVSGFVGRATSLVAQLAAAGHGIEVTSFDSAWHWQSVTGLEAGQDRQPDRVR